MDEDCLRRKEEIIVTGCDLSEGYLTPTDVIHLLPACYLLVGKVNGRRGQNYPNTQPLKRGSVQERWNRYLMRMDYKYN